MITESQHYNKIDFTDEQLAEQYDGCTFTDCNFENIKLSNVTFIECEFENCNLSNAKINVASFKDVTFNGCKLMGVNFNDCNPFLLDFTFNN